MASGFPSVSAIISIATEKNADDCKALFQKAFQFRMIPRAIMIPDNRRRTDGITDKSGEKLLSCGVNQVKKSGAQPRFSF